MRDSCRASLAASGVTNPEVLPQRLATDGDGRLSGHKPAPLLATRNSGMMIGKEDS